MAARAQRDVALKPEIAGVFAENFAVSGGMAISNPFADPSHPKLSVLLDDPV